MLLGWVGKRRLHDGTVNKSTNCLFQVATGLSDWGKRRPTGGKESTGDGPSTLPPPKPGTDEGAHWEDWDGHGGETIRTREEALTAEKALKDQATGGLEVSASEPHSQDTDPEGLGDHSPLLLVK